MPACRLIRTRLLAILAVAAAAHGAELIKVSPFLPPQGAANAPTQNAPLQYMGWVDTAEGRLYRVYDPARKTGAFLKVGESDSNLGVTVKQHDADRDTITIDHGGQMLTLPEHQAKVVSSGAFPQMMTMGPPAVPPPGSNMLPSVTQSVVLNPTPADEQRRLEAVAAEVARRRAMRAQAEQQQMQQAGQPPGIMGRQQMQGRNR